MPESHRTQIIEHLDCTERAEWAQRFANKQDTLGKVIQQVYLERDAHWLAPPPMVDPAPPRVPEPARAPAAGSKLAPSLRDGKALCRAWQNNRCPEQHARNCAEGEHLCAHLLKSGRVYAVTLGTLVASVTINRDVEMTPLAEHLPVSLHVRDLLA